MVAIVTLALGLVLTAQTPMERHVRATEPRILAFIEAGLAGSDTFQGLVAALDASDVIVYVGPKRTRDALGGYLSHNISAAGGYRYLRVSIDTQGSERRVIALLAHELQHAVEVAQSDARDPEALDRLFNQLSVKFGCDGTTCSETRAARDVERKVGDELKAGLDKGRRLRAANVESR